MEELDASHKQNDNTGISIMDMLGGHSETIDRSALTPLNDPNCSHEWVDDDEVIGDKRAQTCRKCPLGRWKQI